MARGSEYKCRCCNKTYTYCRKCQLKPIDYMEDGFCSDKCSEVFKILSKNGCGIATAEETLDALKSFDIDGVELSSSIQAHIDALKAKVKPIEKKQTYKKKNVDEDAITE